MNICHLQNFFAELHVRGLKSFHVVTKGVPERFCAVYLHVVILQTLALANGRILSRTMNVDLTER